MSLCWPVLRHRGHGLGIVARLVSTGTPKGAANKPDPLRYHPKPAVKARPTQMLVATEMVEQVCQRPEPSERIVPRVTPIRVCTPEELRRICPPKPCECPPRDVPLTPADKLKNGIWFAVKACIAGAVVYLTVQHGIWTGSDCTQALYDNVRQYVIFLIWGDDIATVEVLPREGVGFTLFNLWNKTVTFICTFIAHFPQNVAWFGRKVVGVVSNAVKGDK